MYAQSTFISSTCHECLVLESHMRFVRCRCQDPSKLLNFGRSCRKRGPVITYFRMFHFEKF